MEEMEITTRPEMLKDLIVDGKTFRSAFDYKLLPEDLERARLELGETEEVRKISIRTLREMLSGNEEKCRTDDAYLLCYLRCKKFNCKDAFEMLRFQYSVRKDYSEAFSVPSATDLMKHMNKNIVTYLPYRDEEGSLIFLDRFGKWNPEEESVFHLFKFTNPVGVMASMNPCVQIHKAVLIVDTEGINGSYLPAVLRPSVLLFWTRAYQNAYPARIKRIIVVNCNKYFCFVLKSVRFLLKKKFADRITIIGSDMTELHQYVNPAILPKKYGGNLEDNNDLFAQHILDNFHLVETFHTG